MLHVIKRYTVTAHVNAGKAKRPQSYSNQDKGRFTHFFLLFCLHDGLQFAVETKRPRF